MLTDLMSPLEFESVVDVDHLPIFASPLQTLSYGPFTRWICFLNPLGNVPSAVQATGSQTFRILPFLSQSVAQK